MSDWVTTRAPRPTAPCTALTSRSSSTSTTLALARPLVLSGSTATLEGGLRFFAVGVASRDGENGDGHEDDVLHVRHYEADPDGKSRPVVVAKLLGVEA